MMISINSNRYVHENKLSQSLHVRRKITHEMKKIELIENNVIVNHQVLRESTENPETLHVIESRQYRERGLFHINDAAYSFFCCWNKNVLIELTFQSWLTYKKT